MNKEKILNFAKIAGLAMLYLFIFIISVFFTMQTLIKGEEIDAPNFVGKSLSEVETLANNQDIYLKKIFGNYDSHFKPLTIIDQVPSPGDRIKEKSIIKIFITAEAVDVIVPNVVGLNLNECTDVLGKNKLRKKYISYMDSVLVPVDSVISQSIPPGSRTHSGTEINLLVSRGSKEKSYIMPDLIGKNSETVLSYFQNLGFQIATPIKVSYPGIKPGTVIKQSPLSGFRINTKARISIEVSE